MNYRVPKYSYTEDQQAFLFLKRQAPGFWLVFDAFES